jgi:hypothetical protein
MMKLNINELECQHKDITNWYDEKGWFCSGFAKEKMKE